MHRVWYDGHSVETGGLVEVLGEEAAHALRVKRLAPGEVLELIDGLGTVLTAAVEPDAPVHHHTPAGRGKPRRGEPVLRVRVTGRRVQPPVRPQVEILSAAPKGDRLPSMVDQLCQLGVARWGVLTTERGVVEPREGKLERLERVVRESCKQSGRAWAMEIAPAPVTLDEALRAPPDKRVLCADAGGGPIASIIDASPTPRVRVLIGPEGGWTERERDMARAAGAATLGLGPHVLRIETAAVAAAAVLLANGAVV